VGVAERRILARLERANNTGAASLIYLGRRVADVLAVFTGVMIVLYHFGINPTAALAGLGIGGIAVAFAAQKTLENVIGGISIIFDQVVRVGDTLKTGETVGTVESIGLRSTRIRTLDRTLVSVPNGVISGVTLENLSGRDKFWFHHKVGLRYETTAAQMRTILDSVSGLLTGNSNVESDSVRARFLGFGTSSLDVEIFAYVFARDWPHFLALQGELLLQIMEAVESAGAEIAYPSQTMYLEPSGQQALLEAAPSK
jgi:MscS family membrane protein